MVTSRRRPRSSRPRSHHVAAHGGGRVVLLGPGCVGRRSPSSRTSAFTATANSTRCACRSRSCSGRSWPAGVTVRTFEPGRDEAGVARGQQPRLRRPRRTGRLDRRNARTPDARSVVRPGAVPPRVRRRGAGRFQLDQDPRERTTATTARRDLRHRCRPACPGQRSRARARDRRTRCGVPIVGSTTGIVVLSPPKTRPRSQLVPSRSDSRAPRRPRVRDRGGRVMSTRYGAHDARRARRAGRRRSANRPTAPASCSKASTTNGGRSKSSRTCPQALRERARRERCRSRSTIDTCSSPTTTPPRSGCGAPTTAPRSRPCSCAIPTGRPCAFRRRPGARWAARSARPDRPASNVISTRRRSSSKSCAPSTLTQARVERRVHGHGRTARERRRRARRVHAPARRPRALGAPPHRLDGGRRSRHGTPHRVPAPRDARRVAPRTRRRAARPARAAEPPLPHRRRARRPRAPTPTARAAASRSSTPASQVSTTCPQHADALAGRLTGFRGGAHVNLIPLNDTVGLSRPADGANPPDRGVRGAPAGAAALQASVRRNRGTDIDAACGQLRARSEAPNGRAVSTPRHESARMADVSDTKWINPHQPQTLYIGASSSATSRPCSGCCSSRAVCLAVADPRRVDHRRRSAVGGFGVANEKKWGYTVAVVGAVGQLLALLAVFGASTFTSLGPLISFFFDVALVGLLLHPMSRELPAHLVHVSR